MRARLNNFSGSVRQIILQLIAEGETQLKQNQLCKHAFGQSYNIYTKENF